MLNEWSFQQRRAAWEISGMKDGSVFVCPVPEEQQPLNEYQELKDAWFFHWPTRELSYYLTRMAWVWGLAWLVTGPVASSSFAPRKYLGQFLLSGGAGASCFLALALLRLYLGWSYVRDRLLNPTVVYEESGWYDGQSWTKTPEILLRDRLVVAHQIEPILRRLQRTFVAIVIVLLVGGLFWMWL